MRPSAQNHLFFDTARRAFEAVCFYAVVVLVALAIGFVTAVVVLTVPKRGGAIGGTLPAVAWDLPR